MKIVSNISKKNLFFGSLIFCVTAFFLVNRATIQKPGMLESAAAVCAYPLMVLHKIVVSPFNTISVLWTDKTTLQARIQALEKEREQLIEQLIKWEASQFFIEKTKALLDFENRYDLESAQLVQVIMQRIGEDEHAIFVDAGSHHGITTDMAAIYKNSLVGKVVETYTYYSKVLLVTDQRCKVAAYCSETHTPGIYQGTNTFDRSLLTHIDLLKEIKEGERVISSGEGIVFPRGFSLGTVASFTPDGLYYSIIVEPEIDVASLEYCYLIQKGMVVQEQLHSPLGLCPE